MKELGQKEYYSVSSSLVMLNTRGCACHGVHVMVQTKTQADALCRMGNAVAADGQGDVMMADDQGDDGGVPGGLSASLPTADSSADYLAQHAFLGEDGNDATQFMDGKC